MFYYVEGRTAILEQGLAVIDCGGVGYACHTSQNTIGALRVNQPAKLYTHLYVREGIVDLFGFADMEELNCFRMLIGVSGVGPKAALAMLSVATPSQLALAVITEDAKLLTQAPGIGKKTAERVILDLKDKIKLEDVTALPGAGETENGLIVDNFEAARKEAIDALAALGYGISEAAKAVSKVAVTEESTTEEILKMALKNLF